MKGQISYCLLFLTILLPVSESIPIYNEVNYYQEGKIALQKGDWKKALNIWLEAKSANSEEADPRIGIAFIDLVTSRELKKYYSVADQMYMWGLSGADVRTYHHELQKELKRLAPLMDKIQTQRLQKLVDERSPVFTKEIAEYWIRQNPFPNSPFNERLLEHWERIQYAREHFTILSTSPYNTDDRGVIYVRFGAPAEIKKRSVSINRIIDPASGSNIALFSNITFDAEIWYYKDLGKKKHSTTFVFGRPGNGGAFGLQPGILSLVPAGGNRIASYFDDQKVLEEVMNQNTYGGSANATQYDQSGGGLFASPGYTRVSRKGAELMLKYAVLEDIGAIDPFYNNLYNRMTRDIIRESISGRGEKFTQSAELNLASYDNEELTTALLRDRVIPKSKTATKTELQDLEVYHQMLRFMDSRFETIYMVSTQVSLPDVVWVHTGLQGRQFNTDTVYLLNTLYEYDNNGHLKIEQPHLIPLNEDGSFGNGVYYFTEDAASNSIMFNAQYLDKTAGADKEPRHEKLNAYIIASSSMKQINFPPILHLEGPEKAQISDILLAHPQKEQPDQRIPFAPNINKTFGIGAAMLVYFEVYNMPTDSPYKIEYKIAGITAKGAVMQLGRSIILNYTSSGTVQPNWFEVPLLDIPDYPQYELTIMLRDESGRALIRRSTPFFISHDSVR